MKKSYILLTSLMLALTTLSGCGGKGVSVNDSTTSNTPSTPTTSTTSSEENTTSSDSSSSGSGADSSSSEETTSDVSSSSSETSDDSSSSDSSTPSSGSESGSSQSETQDDPSSSSSEVIKDNYHYFQIDNNDKVKIDLNDKQTNYEEYAAYGISVSKDNVFKFYLDDALLTVSAEVVSEGKNNLDSSLKVVKTNASADLYLKHLDNGYVAYLTGNTYEYKVKIGATSYDLNPNPSDTSEKMTNEIASVNKNDLVEFFLDDESLPVQIEEGTNNNLYVTDSKIYVHNNARNVTLYLKDGNVAYLTGYEEPEAKYYIGYNDGDDTHWSVNDGAYLLYRNNEQTDFEEYYLKGISFNANSEFKVFADKDGEIISYFGYEYDDNSTKYVAAATSDEAPNYKVTHTGIYDLYFKIYDDNGTKTYKIYVSADNVEDNYFVQINNSTDRIELKEGDTINQLEAIITADAGDVLKFYYNSNELNVKVDEWSENNLKVSDNQIVVRKAVTKKSLYFKDKGTDGIEVYLDGYYASYSATIDNTSYVLDAIKGEDDKYQAKISTGLTKNSLVRFFLDDESILVNLEDAETNNLKLSDSSILIRKDVANEKTVELTLTKNNDGYLAYLTGYEASYTLMLGENSYEMTKNTEALEVTEYMKTGLTLTKGDAIKFYIDDEEQNLNRKSGDNNIATYGMYIHNDATNAGVYIDITDKTNILIWVGGYKTISEDHTYTVKVGDSDAIDLIQYKVGMPEDCEDQYRALISASRSEMVRFYVDDNLANSVTAEQSNIRNTDTNGELQVIHAVDKEYIYLKVLKEGGYTVYLGGYDKAIYSYKINDTYVDFTNYKEDTNEYYAEELNLSSGDKVTIYKDDISLNATYEQVSNNNLNADMEVINDTTNASLYYKVESNNVWVSGYVEPKTVAANYSLLIDGEVSSIKFIDDSENIIDSAIYQFKIEGLKVDEGAELTFKLNDEVITKIGVDNNALNNVEVNNEKIVVRTSTLTEGADLYLKLYDDGGYSIYFDGYVEPVVEGIKIFLDEVLVSDLECYDADEEILDSDKEAGCIHQYKIVLPTVNKGQILSLTKDGKTILPGSSSDTSNLVYDNEEKTLTIRMSATNVLLYLKEYNDGYDTWLSGYDEAKLFAAYFNNVLVEDATFTNADDEMLDSDKEAGLIHQYKITFASVTKGDVLSIKKDDKAILAGASSGNLTYDSEEKTLIVRTTATNVTLYLKEYNEGYDTYLEGYMAPTITYTITNVPSSVIASTDILYVWAWKDGNDGAFYSATLEGTTITFKVNEECDKFILVKLSDTNKDIAWSNATKIIDANLDLDSKNTTMEYADLVPEVVDTITLYFTKPDDWGDTMYAHYWVSDGKGTGWPGTKMTYVYTNEYNQKVYSITIDEDYEYIIFNDNSHQTSDIKISSFGKNNAAYLDNGTVKYWNYTA